jgi:hypothetical protein
MMGFGRMGGSLGKGSESMPLKRGVAWWMVTSVACELYVKPLSV